MLLTFPFTFLLYSGSTCWSLSLVIRHFLCLIIQRDVVLRMRAGYLFYYRWSQFEFWFWLSVLLNLYNALCWWENWEICRFFFVFVWALWQFACKHYYFMMGVPGFQTRGVQVEWLSICHHYLHLSLHPSKKAGICANLMGCSVGGWGSWGVGSLLPPPLYSISHFSWNKLVMVGWN